MPAASEKGVGPRRHFLTAPERKRDGMNTAWKVMVLCRCDLGARERQRTHKKGEYSDGTAKKAR
jgi:hypothetical protein